MARIGRLLLCVFIVFATSNLAAQSLQQQADMASQIDNASGLAVDGFINNETRPASHLARYEQNQADMQAFGASLFSSRSPTRQRNSINPNYVIAPGDKISVQLWGAFNLSNVYTVDNQGNIFVETVGPIAVADQLAGSVNEVVTAAIKKIYTDNVDIYVNLLAATPVSVFVTGAVTQPGQYAGTSADSVLYYLYQAGGILPERGSYRAIDLVRDKQTVTSIDLYDFLLNGHLSQHSFQDGDVILVNSRRAYVDVEVSSSNSDQAASKQSYELLTEERQGSDLLAIINPRPQISHVAVTGIRKSEPISKYMTLESFKSFELQSGDSLIFNDDIRPQVISVKLSGSYLGPSFYTMDANTRLHDLLSRVSVDPKQADLSSIYILRDSVKEQQKQLLEESLSRLERSVFTAPASSDGEARLRAQEAQLVAQFIDRARQVEPLGRVVVAIDGEVANIRLEQGDEIVIPQRNDLVNVSGEVMLPQAVVYQRDVSVNDYVNWAGGFTERADPSGVLIVHANGATTLLNKQTGWFKKSQKIAIKPGDQVIITPKADSKLMQTFKDVTQIIYQIAVAANVAFN